MKPLSESKIKEFLKKDENTLIKIYTLQHPDILKTTKHHLEVDAEIIFKEEWKECFEFSYNWIKSQMKKHIKNFSGDYPIWAHLRRPNLKHELYNYDGELIYIIALVPKKRILASDYDRWHCVLNNSYCSSTEQEDDSFDNLQITESQRHHQIEDSWERIFKLDQEYTELEKRWLGEEKAIQLCVDRIYLNEIVSIKRVN